MLIVISVLLIIFDRLKNFLLLRKPKKYQSIDTIKPRNKYRPKFSIFNQIFIFAPS